MITLYDSRLSGNSWKVRLVLRHLGIPFRRVTLALADGRHLVESGAILLHLAEGTALLPADAVARAAVTAWLFYDQGDLARFLAYPRFYAMTGQAAAQAEVIAHYHGLADLAMQPVAEALDAGPWLAGERRIYG